MLSNEQLDKFKSKLLKRKEELTSRDTDIEENSTELSQYDNHPADTATELFDREMDLAIDEHSENEMEKIDAALKAIEEGTYGICAVSGKEIPIERLEAMPTALTVVEHANEQPSDPLSRPSEEQVLSPSTAHPVDGEDEDVRDYQDSFSEVARYGTSETPSDMAAGEESYDDMYESDEDGDESIEEDEEVANDMDGKERKIYPNK
ncbi:TraR/DksA C4-type zinc finger protein [Jeotgalibacillus proteolyticus]|uniref:Molecular chaperone DnaK n=1 Tax=Jeotgalibacillus proteolyticus TaxID=2082395 RepID=A0A2S5GFD7_9BACL|nr:TraR/DksA C4-type zinc finger protein [Jeotgalibacillus proteolyticus]PPA71757.1 molecular chaperone DnaK [Jeotgalibacillus proteolyticus]